MDRLVRLQLAGRVTYYLGWIATICGGLVQFNLGTKLFAAMTISKRNLFEASLLFFVISMASELRASCLRDEMPGAPKRQAA